MTTLKLYHHNKVKLLFTHFVVAEKFRTTFQRIKRKQCQKVNSSQIKTFSFAKLFFSQTSETRMQGDLSIRLWLQQSNMNFPVLRMVCNRNLCIEHKSREPGMPSRTQEKTYCGLTVTVTSVQDLFRLICRLRDLATERTFPTLHLKTCQAAKVEC